MVGRNFISPVPAAISKKKVLRKVLSDANYETENLIGGSGAENEEARRIVRLIKAATIGADLYPLSTASLHRDRNAGIDSWENEGGAPRWPNRRDH